MQYYKVMMTLDEFLLLFDPFIVPINAWGAINPPMASWCGVYFFDLEEDGI